MTSLRCPQQTLEGATMPVSVWTSTLKRTIQTAELLPFPKLRWKVLHLPAAHLWKGGYLLQCASSPECVAWHACCHHGHHATHEA